MKLEYEAWQELNPDKVLTQEEYQQAALNTHAFEYESIRNQQENKEFWVQIGALVVIVGVAIICPPAGLALGAAYGSLELSSAISGKDWISGRELGTEERWVRGLLAPLDIVPGVSGLTKFRSTVRLAHIGTDKGQLGIRTGIKGSLNSGAFKVNQLIKTAEQQSAARLRSAASAINDGANVVKNKLARDTLDATRLVDTVITKGKNIMPSRVMNMTDDMGNTVKIRKPAENTQAVENTVRDTLSRISGVNLGSGSTRGTGVVESDYPYNMIENPGPLAKIWGNPAANFLGGKYEVKILDEDVVLYRSGKRGGLTIPGEEKNALGQWFTRKPSESVVKVRIDSAVKSQWIDPKTGEITGTSPIESTYAIKVPKGTTIYEGPVGYQGGSYLGGENCIQLFVQEPWKIYGIEVITETPIE